MGDVGYRPTFEEASVRLFRVVLLPAEGFPTRPMRGSRPIAWQVAVQHGKGSFALENGNYYRL